MSTYIYGYSNEVEILVIEIKRKEKGLTYVSSVCLDDHPLVNRETAEVWSRYFHHKLKDLVNEEAMNSELFKSIEHEIAEEKRRHEEWIASEPERRRREQHKKELRRTPTLGFIPEGLKADYAKEYGWYIDSAIQWTPEDNEEFLYQTRSLERMCTKCVQRCIEQQRPDAAYAQTAELLRSLPRWKSRDDLTDFFNQYKPRLRKLVKTVCQAMISSAIAWNNMEKLIEANALIEGFQSEFTSWGMKPKDMLDCRLFAGITGEPVKIERKPNKQEQQELNYAEQRRKAEARRKAEEEAEAKVIIKLNPQYEELFSPRYIDMDCNRISRNIDTVRKQIDEILKVGMYKQAVTMYLQLVKSMVRHFISDEHYNYFDDMYNPEYSLQRILENIKSYKIDEESKALLEQGHAELRQSECYQDYYIPSFITERSV